MNQNVISCLEAQRNFIFEAGPGSGKTTTLINALRHILANPNAHFNPSTQQIACITYTNVAANEISERLGEASKFVTVSTIHSFLWSIIREYQIELRSLLHEMNKNQEFGKKLYVNELDLEGIEIQYVDKYAELSKGEISHDAVLALACKLFQTYPTLRHFTRATFPILFLDEYQDTHKIVMNIVECLASESEDSSIRPAHILIGLFGDSMQSIYNSGVGSVDPTRFNAMPITETANYRSSTAIVDLINKVRALGTFNFAAPMVYQIAKRDNLPANSRCSLYYTNNEDDLSEQTICTIRDNFGWDAAETKILELTHSAIARTSGWETLQRSFQQNRGSTAFENLRNGDDIYSSTFSFLTNLYNAHSSGNGFQSLQILRLTSPGYSQERYIIQNSEDILALSEVLDDFIAMCDCNTATRSSIRDVLEYAWSNTLCRKTHQITLFEDVESITDSHIKEKRLAFLQSLNSIPFSELVKFYEYLDTYTPYSTQHGTKGSEFKNVVVILDDTAWNQYKWSSIFGLYDKLEQRRYRSLKLFYVAISRARDNLIVIYKQAPTSFIDGAGELFGTDNVQPLTTLLDSLG